MLAMLMLTGCPWNTRPDAPLIQTQIVEVPVFQCPDNHRDISRPTRPPLIIHQISPEDRQDPGKIVQAYKVDIAQLMKYAEGLESGFDSYRGICSIPTKRATDK
jgi:hypothetical protein